MPAIAIQEEDKTDKETFAYMLSKFDDVFSGLFASLESESFYKVERLLYVMLVDQPDVRPKIRLNLVGLPATGKSFLIDWITLIRQQRAVWMYGFNPDNNPISNPFPRAIFGFSDWKTLDQALLAMRDAELGRSISCIHVFSITEFWLSKTDVFHASCLDTTYDDVESFTILLDGKENNMWRVNSFFEDFNEMKAYTTFYFLRRRLALKRWSLLRQHFKDKFWVGGVLAYWAHKTNEPGSKAYKRVFEQNASSFEPNSKKQCNTLQ